MKASGPINARASFTGKSSWPRCTPSAPAARAMSARSLTMNGTPSRRHKRAASRAAASSSPSSKRFSRSCTISTPPRTAASMSPSRPSFGDASVTRYSLRSRSAARNAWVNRRRPSARFQCDRPPRSASARIDRGLAARRYIPRRPASSAARLRLSRPLRSCPLRFRVLYRSRRIEASSSACRGRAKRTLLITRVHDFPILVHGFVPEFHQSPRDFVGRTVILERELLAGLARLVIAARLRAGTGAHHRDAQWHEVVAQRRRLARRERDAGGRQRETQEGEKMYKVAVIDGMSRCEPALRAIDARKRHVDLTAPAISLEPACVLHER